MGIGGLVLAILSDTGMIQMQLMTTVPILAGISCFYTAWSKGRSPSRITIDKEALTLETKGESRRLTWEQVGWADKQSAPMSAQPHLVVYAPDGKTITKIINDFPGFDQLVELLTARIERKTDGVAAEVQKKTFRKQGLLLCCLGPFFILIAAANVWIAWDEQRTDHLFATQAVMGEATVLRHFVAPDGRTKRMKYRVTTPEGLTGEHNVEVDPTLWQMTKGFDTVQVLYVPSEPSISKLLFGEIEDPVMDMNPRVMYWASGAMALLGLIAVVIGAMNLKGIDIEKQIKQWFVKRAA